MFPSCPQLLNRDLRPDHRGLTIGQQHHRDFVEPAQRGRRRNGEAERLRNRRRSIGEEARQAGLDFLLAEVESGPVRRL